jgi:hypothetical protein
MIGQSLWSRVQQSLAQASTMAAHPKGFPRPHRLVVEQVR